MSVMIVCHQWLKWITMSWTKKKHLQSQNTTLRLKTLLTRHSIPRCTAQITAEVLTARDDRGAMKHGIAAAAANLCFENDFGRPNINAIVDLMWCDCSGRLDKWNANKWLLWWACWIPKNQKSKCKSPQKYPWDVMWLCCEASRYKYDWMWSRPCWDMYTIHSGV